MTTATLTATPPLVRRFLATDRCDRCGAQAYVAAEIHNTELLFCLHHSNVHMSHLLAAGGVKTGDESWKLTQDNRNKGEAHA